MKTCGTLDVPSSYTGETDLGGSCRQTATHLVGIYDTIPFAFMCEPCALVWCWSDDSVAKLDENDKPGEWGAW